MPGGGLVVRSAVTVWRCRSRTCRRCASAAATAWTPPAPSASSACPAPAARRSPWCCPSSTAASAAAARVSRGWGGWRGGPERLRDPLAPSPASPHRPVPQGGISPSADVPSWTLPSRAWWWWRTPRLPGSLRPQPSNKSTTPGSPLPWWEWEMGSWEGAGRCTGGVNGDGGGCKERGWGAWRAPEGPGHLRDPRAPRVPPEAMPGSETQGAPGCPTQLSQCSPCPMARPSPAALTPKATTGYGVAAGTGAEQPPPGARSPAGGRCLPPGQSGYTATTLRLGVFGGGVNIATPRAQMGFQH